MRWGNIEVVNALLSEIRTMKDYERYKILSAQLVVSVWPVNCCLVLFDVVECINHTLNKLDA